MSASLRKTLLGAVEKALAGDWQAAHVIVQDHEEDATANWIHAVCHRMEGDASNARYWYRRIGREYRPDLAAHTELEQIKAQLSA